MVKKKSQHCSYSYPCCCWSMQMQFGTKWLQILIQPISRPSPRFYFPFGGFLAQTDFKLNGNLHRHFLSSPFFLNRLVTAAAAQGEESIWNFFSLLLYFVPLSSCGIIQRVAKRVVYAHVRTQREREREGNAQRAYNIQLCGEHRVERKEKKIDLPVQHGSARFTAS